MTLRAVVTGSAQLSATASSEVSDPVSTNNSSATQVDVGPARLPIPVPTWALALTAALLGGIGAKAVSSTSRRT